MFWAHDYDLQVVPVEQKSNKPSRQKKITNQRLSERFAIPKRLK